MPLTRFPNGVVTGDGNSTTTSYAVMSIPFSFDPTSSSQIELATLPANSRVVDIIGYGGAIGGTNPAVDIGTSGDDDGFANELDCDAASTRATSAATVGASAATGGTFAGAIEYIITA
jgi:hypothetical protein